MEELDLKTSGFIKNHDFKFIEYKDNCCIIEAPINEISLNPYDIVHGGLIYGLMDTCSGVHVFLETKRNVVTTSGNINYIKKCKGSKIIAKSKQIKIGNNISIIEVNAYNENNEIVATGIFNFYFID